MKAVRRIDEPHLVSSRAIFLGGAGHDLPRETHPTFGISNKKAIHGLSVGTTNEVDVKLPDIKYTPSNQPMLFSVH